MAQPLCSALQGASPHLYPRSGGHSSSNWGASRLRYSTRQGEQGVVMAEHDLAASERAGEAEQVPQTSSGNLPAQQEDGAVQIQTRAKCIFFLNSTDNNHCNKLQHHK